MYTDSMPWLLALAVIVVPLLLAWLLIGRDEYPMRRRKPERRTPGDGG